MKRKMVSLQDLEMAIKARRMEAEQVARDCGMWWAVTQLDNEEWLEEDPYSLYGGDSAFIRVEGEHRSPAASHIADNDPDRVLRQCRSDLEILEQARTRFDALAKLDDGAVESLVLRQVCAPLAVVVRMIGLNYFENSTVDVGLGGM